MRITVFNKTISSALIAMIASSTHAQDWKSWKNPFDSEKGNPQFEIPTVNINNIVGFSDNTLTSGMGFACATENKKTHSSSGAKSLSWRQQDLDNKLKPNHHFKYSYSDDTPESSSYDFMFSKKEQNAKAYYIDQKAKQAMQKIYNKTGSSVQAKEKVQQAIDRHGCNGAAVQKIGFHSWLKPSGSVMSLYKTLNPYASPTLSTIYIANGEFAPLFESQKQYIDKTEAAVASMIWVNLSYSGACAQVMEGVQALCSGKISARDVFESLHQNPEMANGAVIKGFQWLSHTATGVVILNTLKDMGKELYGHVQQNSLGELRREQEQMRQENESLYKEIAKLDSHLNDLNSMSSDAHHTSVIESEKSTTEQIKADRLAEIQANEKRIKEIDLDLVQADANHKPEHASGDTKNSPYDELAFQSFLEHQWKPMQEALLKHYKSCRNESGTEVKTPLVDTTIPNNYGATCDYSGAMLELERIINPNPNTPPSEEDWTYNILDSGLQQNLDKVMKYTPHCNPYTDTHCAAMIDAHMKNSGFDGGTAEFCAVTGANAYCPTDLGVIPGITPEKGLNITW